MKTILKTISLTLLFVTGLFTQQELSIYDIQYTEDPIGNSPYMFDTVATYGIVTGIFQQYRFFIEEYPGGAWHGVYVFRGGNSQPHVSLGDSVKVVGVVNEYYGLTEIDASADVGVGSVTVLSSGHPLPGPTVLPTGEVSQEMYEGVYIEVDQVVVESLPNQYGEWWVNDGSGPLMIDDMGVSYSPQLGDIFNIRGCLSFGYGTFRLEPRDSSDIMDPPPVITDIQWTPTVPSPYHDVTINALIQDNSMVFSDSIFYQVNGNGFMPFYHDSVSQNIYYFSIPGHPAGDSIDFYLWAIDDAGGVSISDTFTYKVVPSPPPVIHYLEFEPTHPLTNDVVTVWAKITDDSQVIADSMYYILNNSEIHSNVPDSIVSDIRYYHIPSQPGGTSVSFFVIAVDDSGKKAVSDTLGYEVWDLSQTIPISYLHVLDNDGNPILLGHQVIVRGVVTVAGELGVSFYLQDSSGGVVAYNPNFTADRGDTVRITGSVSIYNGLVELNNADLLDRKPGDDPTPEVVTISQLLEGGEVYEGVLVQIRDVTTDATVFPTGQTITIQDSTGSFTLYVDNDTDLGGRKTPSGKFHVTGVISQYDPSPPYFEGYQIVPRGSFDLVTGGDGSGTARVIPPYFPRGYSGPLSIEITMGIDTINFIAVSIPDSTMWSGDSADVSFIGDGFNEATFNVTPTDIEISNAHVVIDTIVINNFTVPDTGEFQITVSTGVHDLESVQPIIVQPHLFGTIPISEVQEPGEDGYSSSMVNQSVTVAGVVTFPAGISSTDRTSIFIQDPTGGVNIYYSNSLLPIILGDVVLVKGIVTEYNGLTEVSVSSLSDMSRLDRGYAIPDTYRLRPGEILKEELEGRFVKLDGAVVATQPSPAGAGFSMDLWNGQVPVTAYIYPGTGIDVNSLHVGDVINILGVVGQYDSQEPYTSGYQLLPRFAEDIHIVTPETTSTVDLILSKNVFAPDLNNENLRIKVLGPGDYRYTLKVFDLKGRTVKVFFESAPGKTGIFVWDGTNDTGGRLPLGMYIVQLKAIKGTDQRVINRVVVISTPFK